MYALWAIFKRFIYLALKCEKKKLKSIDRSKTFYAMSETTDGLRFCFDYTLLAEKNSPGISMLISELAWSCWTSPIFKLICQLIDCVSMHWKFTNKLKMKKKKQWFSYWFELNSIEILFKCDIVWNLK